MTNFEIFNRAPNSFEEALKYGEVGEFIAYKAIMKSPFLTFKQDVRKEKDYQVIDVDFLVDIHSLFGTEVNVPLEVKADFTHVRTGNMFFPTIDDKYTGRLGSFLRTKSNLIAYVFAHEQKVLLMKTHDLRKWMTENSYKFDIIQVGAKSMGFVVNSNYFLQNFEGEYVFLDV